jgi:hypothetical protein
MAYWPLALWPSSPVPRPVLLLLCSIGLLGACDVTIKDGDVSINQLHGRATREWTREYPLAIGGRVEIVNPNGSIDVQAGPEGKVAVVAILAAHAMTDDRAKDTLSDASIEESAAPNHIKLTTSRGTRGGRLEVTYKMTVPADARVEMSGNNGTHKAAGLRGHVKAMVVNGGVELTGLRGSVDVASVNASVSVTMAEVTAPIRIESTNGRIRLEVPKDAKAALNARAVNGGITVTGLTAQEASGRRIRDLESVLNGGGPEIQVRITNGHITIEGK